MGGGTWARNLSRSLADLLNGLLCPDERRLTTEAAAAHPWVSAPAAPTTAEQKQ